MALLASIKVRQWRGGWSIHAARRGSDDALHNGITLNATWAKHRPTDSILLVFKGSRPPLPHHLQPTRPP
jgi:hypothetical protein